MEKEVWKIIPGISNYEVSNLGRFRHVKHKKIRKPRYQKGYCRYTFKGDDREIKTALGHRMVFFTFNPDADQTKQLDHINRVRDDNRLSNLRLSDPLLNAANRNPRKSYGPNYVPLHKIKNILRLKELSAEEIFEKLKTAQ